MLMDPLVPLARVLRDGGLYQLTTGRCRKMRSEPGCLGMLDVGGCLVE